MNRNEFINLIRNTGEADRQTTSEIRELVDLFPWFHSAHLLLLKGLHDTGDIRFENQLRQSAIYLADREVLYYLLRKEPGKKEVAASEKPAEPEVKSVAQSVENIDSQQVVIETGKNSEELIKVLEHTPVISGSATEEPTVPGHDITETFIVTAESETDESASVVLMIDDGDSHIEKTVIFMDPSINTEEVPELLELDEAQGGAEEPATAEDEENSGQIVADDRKKVQSELIDRFILANPRIEPVREKSDKPNDDLSKPYTEVTGGLVSETLARIYVNQGYYSRAIDIYEKLSLKYPEKSSYFAAQIEKVKALIK